MTYLQFIKTHDNIEKYVLFLLSLDFSVAETAKMVGMTRQAIYVIVNRNKTLVDEYMAGLKEITEKPGLSKP